VQGRDLVGVDGDPFTVLTCDNEADEASGIVHDRGAAVAVDDSRREDDDVPAVRGAVGRVLDHECDVAVDLDVARAVEGEHPGRLGNVFGKVRSAAGDVGVEQGEVGARSMVRTRAGSPSTARARRSPSTVCPAVSTRLSPTTMPSPWKRFG